MKKIIIALSAILMIAMIGCDTAQKEASSVSSKIDNSQTHKQNEMEKQSKATMDVAMAFMDAMGKGDMETMVSLMDDNMVWQNEGDSRMPWIGPWEGKKTILEEFLPLFMEHFKTTKWDIEDAISSSDVAAFFGRMKGITLQNGQETKEFTFALRVKVKDGKIVLWNWFEDSFEVSRAFNTK